MSHERSAHYALARHPSALRTRNPQDERQLGKIEARVARQNGRWDLEIAGKAEHALIYDLYAGFILQKIAAGIGGVVSARRQFRGLNRHEARSFLQNSG